MKDPSTNGGSGLTRRRFIKAGGAAAAGLAAGPSFAQDKADALAVKGGPKAVTFPSAETSALTRWPRFGEAEKKRLHELIGQYVKAFEKVWAHRDQTANL